MDIAEATLAARRIDGTAIDLREALAAEGLPTDDLAESGRTFFRFEDLSGRVAGFGGYELHDNDAFLRSMVVVAGARGRGVGREMLTHLLDHAKSAGAKRAFLITSSARGFFERAGFVVLSREAAPPAILATRQAAGLCSKRAPLLTKSL